MDWIDPAQDRDQISALVNTGALGFKKMLRNFLSRCTIGSFSRRAQLHERVGECHIIALFMEGKGNINK
jgi:hypothetical protein